MSTFKRRCLDLRKNGHSLTEIIKITGRPKSSVYFHISKIPLDRERQKVSIVASGIRARKLALARKGKSKRSFKKFALWDKNMVLLVSHLIFDGTINRTSCVYNNRNKPLLSSVERCMKEIYNYKPKKYFDKKTGVSRIGYFNVSLSAYLQIKSRELLKGVRELPKDLHREFVRAFFDDEGCIDFRPKRNLRQIRGYQKNLSILYLVQNLLRNFGIKSNVVRPNEIVIRGKKYLKKFEEEINFSPGVRLNGDRKNSIWRKPLEKRVLLKQAILSFKD